MLSAELRDEIVARLIRQYHEYTRLQAALDTAKAERIMSSDKDAIDKKVSLIKTLQQQTSDEMTFASPLIWIAYKARAYKNTPQAIDTVEDFRVHCSPKGYICTKRYAFMAQYLQEKYGLILASIPGELPLEQFANLPEITQLEADLDFMQQWQAREYHRTEGRVAKWELDESA